nr:hypothetical protein Itr_chr14CG06280 [Ipomoea trifida]
MVSDASRRSTYAAAVTGETNQERLIASPIEFQERRIASPIAGVHFVHYRSAKEHITTQQQRSNAMENPLFLNDDFNSLKPNAVQNDIF